MTMAAGNVTEGALNKGARVQPSEILLQSLWWMAQALRLLNAAMHLTPQAPATHTYMLCALNMSNSHTQVFVQPIPSAWKAFPACSWARPHSLTSRPRRGVLQKHLSVCSLCPRHHSTNLQCLIILLPPPCTVSYLVEGSVVRYLSSL